MREPASLLHNMSVPCKTVVSYSGLAAADASLRGGASRSGDSSGQSNGRNGAAVHFSLGPRLTAKTPRGILRLLHVKPGPDPEAELLAMIEARAAELPLPSGCLLLRPCDAQGHRVIWPDLLSALAVLTKCSDHIWLRAKNPSLSAALARHEATLFVPPILQHRLPKENA